MLKISFIPEKFRHILKMVSVIHSETRMVFNEKGLSILMIDDDRTRFVELFMDKSAFQEYECTECQKTDINLKLLMKILANYEGNTATLIHDPETKETSIYAMINNVFRKCTHQKMELGDSGIHPEALAAIQYHTKMIIPLQYIQDAIAQVKIYSDVVEIRTSLLGIGFFADNSYKKNTSEYFVKKSDNDIIESNISALFAIKKLEDILGAAKEADCNPDVRLYLIDNKPLRLDFSLPQNTSVKYYIAPRVEE